MSLGVDDSDRITIDRDRAHGLVVRKLDDSGPFKSVEHITAGQAICKGHRAKVGNGSTFMTLFDDPPNAPHAECPIVGWNRGHGLVGIEIPHHDYTFR